jgi:hypothetical protein
LTGWGVGRPGAFAGDLPVCFAEPDVGASALPTPMKLVRRAGAVGGVTFVAPQSAADAAATSRRLTGFALGCGLA